MRAEPATRPVRIVLIALMALVMSVPPIGQASTDAPQFSYESITPKQSETISSALDLFQKANLALPDIHFVGHDDRRACHGRDGAARQVGSGAVVNLCFREVGPVQEWVTLHEIAHVWDYHSLDDERREDFVALRNLEGWREGEWHERGAENAAEILVWGLMDRPVRPARIYDNSCQELLAGYLTLTGQPPLHGYTDVCER